MKSIRKHWPGLCVSIHFSPVNQCQAKCMRDSSSNFLSLVMPYKQASSKRFRNSASGSIDVRGKVLVTTTLAAGARDVSRTRQTAPFLTS
jgi:hypothetical protein